MSNDRLIKELQAQLEQARDDSAARNALDGIANAGRFPEWEYPAQLVRDVAQLREERDEWMRQHGLVEGELERMRAKRNVLSRALRNMAEALRDSGKVDFEPDLWQRILNHHRIDVNYLGITHDESDQLELNQTAESKRVDPNQNE